MFSQWNLYEPNNIIQFFTFWQPILPSFQRANILEQLILPKIDRAIQNHQHYNLPLHIWLHPWLPVLEQDQIMTLWSSTRQALHRSVMAMWQQNNINISHSIMAQLNPWKDVAPDNEYQKLLNSTVGSRLISMMKTQFEINPFQQDLTIFARGTSMV